ncbi:MAG: hypothetical protein WC043_03290 [Pseudobdellovibrionaceae bacterium]
MSSALPVFPTQQFGTVVYPEKQQGAGVASPNLDIACGRGEVFIPKGTSRAALELFLSQSFFDSCDGVVGSRDVRASGLRHVGAPAPA